MAEGAARRRRRAGNAALVRDEPDRGPAQRERYFLEQRTATLRPRDQQELAPTTGLAPTVAPEFRRERIDEYRGHQLAGREADSQSLAPSPAPANNWIPIGPSVVRRGQVSTRAAVSGRVAGIAVANSASRIYVAGANSGVWRSDDAGLTWRSTMESWDLDPTSNASDSLACGAIAIDPASPDRVYVGTGEGDTTFISGGTVVGSGAYFGVGPIRSDDGGGSWFTEPTAPGSPPLAGAAFYRLAIDPSDRERVVAATTVGLYRRELAAGSPRWVQKQAGIFTGVAAARAPGGATTFYAARWGGGVTRSPDGSVWTAVGTGFPTTNVGRIGLAVQPTNPNVVYAIVVHATTDHLLGIWRLDVSGTSAAWRQVSGAPTDLFGSTPSQPGQGWYDCSIVVDPNNVNRVYVGGSTQAVTSLPSSDPARWSGCIYRCQVTSSGAGSSLSYSMSTTPLGATTHADIHALEFTPTDPNQLWVGCDGGMFFTNAASGAASFEPRNVGLQTLTMNHLAIHPTEDAVLFCGTQDNGTTRYTGEEAWLHSSYGDGGYGVINWADPYRVIRTYVGSQYDVCSDGGAGYDSWSTFMVPVSSADNELFYAPLAGTPRSATATDADIVAFGSRRVWISTNFGSTGAWQSIPNNTLAGDQLLGQVRALEFATPRKLYAGTTQGGVYRFDRGTTSWTRTRIDNVAAGALGLTGPITSIATDWSDASGNSVYVTFGGTGDYRHVWRFDGTRWQQRSGPAAGTITSLLDVQHNSIVVDPANPGHVYVGADIGVWRSTNGGVAWSAFSSGLPDAAVIDLKLHQDRRLLWAATYGRGVYERAIDLDNTNAAVPAVQLYVRDTQLDLGRRTTVNGLPDPTQSGASVAFWAGPDVKVDVPTASGYQTPTPQIDFFQFVDTIVDGSGAVATLPSGPGLPVVHNRVYVQVHNRGVQATDPRVMLLLANASMGLPALPANYWNNVQTMTPIMTADWRTVGFATLTRLSVGFPQIAYFDLPSTILPPPASLPGQSHYCLVALLHSADDPYTNTQTNVGTLVVNERKAVLKNLHIVQLTGTAPIWTPVRMYGRPTSQLVSDLVLDLHGYKGRVRVALPAGIKLRSAFDASLENATRAPEDGAVTAWASSHLQRLQTCIDKQAFDGAWCKDMTAAVQATQGGAVVSAADPTKPAVLRQVVIAAKGSVQVFLAIEPPRGARPGSMFEFDLYQRDAKRTVLGASRYRVKIVRKT